MKTKQFIYLLLISSVMTGLFSCATIPKGVVAVKPFVLDHFILDTMFLQ